MKQSIAHGTPIYVYVVCPNSPSGFCFIRSFVSYREAGRYFGLAHTAISSRLISGNFINYSRGAEDYNTKFRRFAQNQN